MSPNFSIESYEYTKDQQFSTPGWGIHAGRLPMYSPVWTNDKPWLQKWARKLVSSLTELSSSWFPSSSRRSASGSLTGRSFTASPNSSNLVFVSLCAIWYTTSALSSNTGKALLNQFRYPITLTFVQFGFVAFYCLLAMSPAVRLSKLRSPTKAIVRDAIPMGLFQVGGHICSSIAISRIPVSTVHTIKALSPLFTVAAYALLFGVSYSRKTYISLLPLTIGVMLACSFDVSASNFLGLLSAFGSALVFVSSNIFFKKIMPTNGNSTSSHKLDKMNLLLYSSGMAFLFMIPIWLYYDLPNLLSGTPSIHKHSVKPAAHSVMYYFFANGTVHFAQNIIAFIILSSTSPVTYSIASLIKRVAVICIAIVWFNQSVHPVQAFGIAMTFTGLYMYNQAKGDVEKGEKKLKRLEAARDLVMPTTKEESRELLGESLPEDNTLASGSIYGRPRGLSLHTPHHRPLTVKTLEIVPEAALNKMYPSPPASHDSPPSETTNLPPPSAFARDLYPHGRPQPVPA